MQSSERETVSFIISVDNSFPMANNFFEFLLAEEFVSACEVVIIIDGCDSLSVRAYIEEIASAHSNIKYKFIPKQGYGIANNQAVGISSGDYLFFINTDVFAKSCCFETLLETLSQGEADCVQPVLIFPQTGLAQCCGTCFGPFFKSHLFTGNIATAPIVSTTDYRQALNSALYAMRRETFDRFGGFDEFYFNKLESFELSYKLSLSGGRCLFCSEAKAYHATGGGRNRLNLMYDQQEAFFWARFGGGITQDIARYLNLQIDVDMASHAYRAIAVNPLRMWGSTLKETSLRISSLEEKPWVTASSLNFFDVMSQNVIFEPYPLLIIVDNIAQLNNNLYWFECRSNPYDIAVDRHGNLVNIKNYLALAHLRDTSSDQASFSQKTFKRG